MAKRTTPPRQPQANPAVLPQSNGKAKPKARPALGSAEHDAYLQEVEAACQARDEADDRVRERIRLAYTITTMDIVLYHEPSRTPLDEVIADQVAYVEKYDDGDLAIWQGSMLLAVVTTDANGKGVVTRFGNGGSDR